MALIHHLVPAAEFEAAPADRPFLPTAFPQDGFIHCTHQTAILLAVANRFYRHVPGRFLVLDIDTQRVTAEVRFEPGAPPAPEGSPLAGAWFPHIYGPLNRDAIVAVRPAERAPDGAFLGV